MNYSKPALTFPQQADLLISRGLIGDRDLMIERLTSVNYYRLTGYWYPFRNPDDTFHTGTTFEQVWDRYVFDRRMKLLVMDAIERIEICVRTQLAYQHSHQHGPMAYAVNAATLPNLNSSKYAEFIAHVEEETKRSREPFVEHFKIKYGTHQKYLPVWMVTEILSLGTVLSFFRGVDQKTKQDVAALFRVPDRVFDSWLLALNTVRNICAHHSRLWNRELRVKPLMPADRKFPDWHVPVKVDNSRLFGILTICRHCLRHIAPQTHWQQRVRALIEEFPAIPMPNMGFPRDWEKCPIWTDDVPSAP